MFTEVQQADHIALPYDLPNDIPGGYDIPAHSREGGRRAPRTCTMAQRLGEARHRLSAGQHPHDPAPIFPLAAYSDKDFWRPSFVPSRWS
jgi:hypothetical protein